MLESVGLCKQYRRRRVLDGVSFALAPGLALGVAGHNGSGKSTLLAVVAQVLPPDAGQLLLDGKNVLGNRAFLRASIGYVPQQGGLLADLRVDETVRFWQRAYGLADAGFFASSSVFAMMGLGALAKKRVGQLSGGEQKRLSIAIALMHRPAFVLLDEAFTALDRKYRQALDSWLEAHLKQGGAMLHASHEIDGLVARSDEILVLRHGTAAYQGPAAAFPQDGAALDELLNDDHTALQAEQTSLTNMELR